MLRLAQAQIALAVAIFFLFFPQATENYTNQVL